MILKTLSFLFSILIANAQETQSLGVTSLKSISVSSAEMGCGLLSYPGDIILQHEETFTEHRLGDNLILAAKIKEILSFKRPQVKYGHAEIITEVARDNSHLSLVSWSFYPPRFQAHLPEEDRKGPFIQFGFGENPIYRMNFSVYRVRPSVLSSVTELREEALSNIQYRSKDSVYGFREVQSNDQTYPNPENGMQKVEFGTRMSVCSDFVAWAYAKHITSWWNRVPGVSKIIATVYPFEALMTPDDLATSPDTQKVCEISNLDLKIPGGKVLTKDVLALAVESLRSKNETLVKQGKWIVSQLFTNNIIDSDYRILETEFTIQVASRPKPVYVETDPTTQPQVEILKSSE